MGSGDWFKTIISSKKVKDDRLKQVKSRASARSNGFKWKSRAQKGSTSLANGSTVNTNTPDVPAEELAATHIQTAFRAYMARKALRHLKGIVRLQALTQSYSVKKQSVNTLKCLHSWSKIQSEIRARRLCMVTEGQLRQKKLENQLKLEAKLHELEVEWCGGAETMEEALAKIHLREQAALKRERAMAYAFSHQWRANSNQNFGRVNYEPGKANWGWSWKERWIAARPWESLVPAKSTMPKKVQNEQANKGGKNSDSPARKTPVSSKTSLSNQKGTIRARRLSYPIAEKPATIGGSRKAGEAKAKTEQLVSLQPGNV
uniref:Uncharacterized protein MANES_16G035300 n=1 Tax=Rhizophora mucronata TaxID=61149 RepID=A0A2P2L5B3_RHIMU